MAPRVDRIPYPERTGFPTQSGPDSLPRADRIPYPERTGFPAQSGPDSLPSAFKTLHTLGSIFLHCVLTRRRWLRPMTCAPRA